MANFLSWYMFAVVLSISAYLILVDGTTSFISQAQTKLSNITSKVQFITCVSFFQIMGKNDFNLKCSQVASLYSQEASLTLCCVMI